MSRKNPAHSKVLQMRAENVVYSRPKGQVGRLGRQNRISQRDTGSQTGRSVQTGRQVSSSKQTKWTWNVFNDMLVCLV